MGVGTATDGAADVIVLQDGSGNDIIRGFDAPTGSGTNFTGIDTLDVSNLYDLPLGDPARTPVRTNDVVVSDDGSGNALLTFPNGESITLVGISPADADNPFYLNAIGIPMPDGTVEGTAGADVIDQSYTGDPDGDMVDGDDAILAGDTANDDLIYGYDGNDSITAGDGNDEIYGGTGNDTIGDFGTDAGNDTVFGGEGDDRLNGGIGDDTVYGGTGNDYLMAGTGTDTLYGGEGSDFFAVTDDHDSTTIVGGEDVEEHKPHPEGLLLAKEKLKIKKEQAIYIGDSLVDVEAAKAAEIDFIAVLTGTVSKQVFEDKKCRSIQNLHYLLQNI